MKVPVGRIMAVMTRREEDKKLAELVQRVRLALAEVKVVERRAEGKIVGRAIVNPDALRRVKVAYMRASQAVGALRLAAAGGTVRLAVRQADEQLNVLHRQLGELEALY